VQFTCRQAGIAPPNKAHLMQKWAAGKGRARWQRASKASTWPDFTIAFAQTGDIIALMRRSVISLNLLLLSSL